MNEHAKNRKPKGITVEGFWSQIKDKTTKTQRETDYRDSLDVSEVNDKRDLRVANDDWVARFDDWLNRL